MSRILPKIAVMAGGDNAVQECLYGFIMPLTLIITALFGIINVDDNISMIILILGMDFSWGLIDMIVFYYVDVLAEKRYVRVLKDDSSRESKRPFIRRFLSGSIVDVLDEKDRERIVDGVLDSEIGSDDYLKQLRHDDLISCIMCFVITMLTTIPPIICLILVPNLRDALTVAATVSSICLFIVGYRIGSYLGTKGWKTGSALLIVSLSATAIASVFGG